MSIASYQDLVTAVSSWLARDDLTLQIPNFIALTEAKLNRVLRCREMERRSFTTIDITSLDFQYITLPEDYQTMRSVCLTSAIDKPRLQYLNDDQIKDYRSNIGDMMSQPRYFSVFGTEIELVPKPDSNYTIEMIYRGRIPALTSTNTTNWLMVQSPDIYLYGVLLEASAYMKNDARIPVWTAGFSNAIDTLNGLTKDAVD